MSFRGMRKIMTWSDMYFPTKTAYIFLQSQNLDDYLINPLW